MADDNLPQKSGFSGTPDNEQEQNPAEVLEETRARVVELEGLVAQKDNELGSANARITELEQAIAESDKKLVDTSSALSQVVSSYKALVVKSNPGVPEELITGDTIEAIDESLANAQTLIDTVRKELEAEIAAAKVPAGAPQRAPVDLSALSPREKIQYAIGGKK